MVGGEVTWASVWLTSPWGSLRCWPCMCPSDGSGTCWSGLCGRATYGSSSCPLSCKFFHIYDRETPRHCLFLPHHLQSWRHNHFRPHDRHRRCRNTLDRLRLQLLHSSPSQVQCDHYCRPAQLLDHGLQQCSVLRSCFQDSLAVVS